MATQKNQTASELEQALASHEEICSIRYESIEKRLDDGQQRFIRIEAQIWGLYVLMIGSTVLGQALGG